MRYLIDIGHPAHVHYFKNLARQVINNGNTVLFTCRNKEITKDLLIHYGFDFISFGRNYYSILGKLFGLFYFTLRIFIISLKFEPNIYLNASIYSAFVAWCFRKPHISLEDTFNKEQVNLYLPFTSCVLTGDYFHPSLGKKEIRYKGYQELLYLQPNIFKPSKTILKKLGLSKNEKYVIMRFVAWSASHDIGYHGMSILNKIRAVNAFEQLAKIYITSETPLPKELQKYKFPLSPFDMHDALAGASLVFGESATMVSEAAMLGIPGIYIDSTGRFYTKDQEKKYGLCFNFSASLEDQARAIRKGVEILMNETVLKEWQQKRIRMLKDNIDVSAFLIWFIENWPRSFKIMKYNPDYQLRFR